MPTLLRKTSAHKSVLLAASIIFSNWVLGAGNSGEMATESMCQSVRRLAVNIKKSYDSGEADSVLIKSLGGVNRLGSLEWAVISYVNQIKQSPDLNSNNIGKLTYEKCKAGGFDGL